MSIKAVWSHSSSPTDHRNPNFTCRVKEVHLILSFSIREQNRVGYSKWISSKGREHLILLPCVILRVKSVTILDGNLNQPTTTANEAEELIFMHMTAFLKYILLSSTIQVR